MRYLDLICEDGEIVPNIDAKKLRKAAVDGFDTSKVWYHGTRRKFANFRLPKGRGIDELGVGVYVTRFVGTANVWAQGQGSILACVLRKGKLIELSELPTSQLWYSGPDAEDRHANINWREVYRGYGLYMTREFGPESTPDYREFAERFNRRAINLAKCLGEVGYIGATNRHSQIRGQAVVWDPANVRIVGKVAGVDGWVSDTPHDQAEHV